MKNRLIFIFLFYCLPASLFAQSDPFLQMNAAYDSISGTMDENYQFHLNRMDSAFYEMLQNDWTLFPLQEGFEETDYRISVSFSEEVPSKKEKISIADITADYYTVNLTFFCAKIAFTVDRASVISLRSISEKDVAEALIRLEKTGYLSVIRTLNQSRNTLKLNDWAILLLCEQLSEAIFPEEKQNEQKCFQSFILNKMGYDVRLGRVETSFFSSKKLCLLLPFKTKVFRQNYITINDCYFYLHGKQAHQKMNGIYSYKSNRSYSSNFLDLLLNEPPYLGCKEETRATTIAGGKNIDLKWKRELVLFYDQYPQTEMAVYFRAGMSQELKQSLHNAFGSLAGKNKMETCRDILYWFQKEFSYQTDDEQFGYQWSFFPEQSLHYPFTDCEDRAVLFAHIIKELMDLDIILIVYPTHVIAGICLDDMSLGDAVSYENKTYIIFDSSYFNAPVGVLMPSLKNQKPEIIKL